MQIDAVELTKDDKFWENEKEIQANALNYITKMKDLKPYDLHKIGPSTYDINMTADSLGTAKKRKGKGKKASKSEGGTSKTQTSKKRGKANDKDANKKAAKKQNLPGLMDEIPEEDAPQREDTDVSDDSEEADDAKYDPLNR